MDIEYDVKVCAGHLVSFGPGVNVSEKKDVLNSLLFIELNTNDAAGAQPWSKRAEGAFTATQWVMRSSDASNLTPAGADFSIGQLVEQYLGENLNPRGVAQLSDVLSRFNSLPEDHPAHRLFYRYAVRESAVDKSGNASTIVRFQISIVGRGPSLMTLFVELDIARRMTSQLFVERIQVKDCIGRIELSYNERVLQTAAYGGTRAKVLAYLAKVKAPTPVSLPAVHKKPGEAGAGKSGSTLKGK
ncbi:hypothetical protein LZ023_01055 [Pseudomonas silvicola]|nr:hypothetical protein LZ023_01055 [Pseudomonas silvicola]